MLLVSLSANIGCFDSRRVELADYKLRQGRVTHTQTYTYTSFSLCASSCSFVCLSIHFLLHLQSPHFTHFAQVVLHMSTGGTRLATLRLPPGRNVLRVQVACPTRYSVSVLSLKVRESVSGCVMIFMTLVTLLHLFAAHCITERAHSHSLFPSLLHLVNSPTSRLILSGIHTRRRARCASSTQQLQHQFCPTWRQHPAHTPRHGNETQGRGRCGERVCVNERVRVKE